MPSDRQKHPDPYIVALGALGWVLGDSQRTDRLLGVTGLAPEALRARATDPTLLAAILGFLEAHEPDLLACAEAIDQSPAALVAARETLER